MDDSFYQTLEVNENASIDEIKKSYRRLSMLYHPDKNKNNPDATAKFQKISESYETLGDVDKKKKYDMTRNNPFFKMMSSNNGDTNPVDELFSSLFGMQFGQGLGQGLGQGFGQGLGQGTPFGQNIRIFHNGVPINVGQGIQKPIPIVKNITIPIDKILTGATIPIDIERWILEEGSKVFEKETIYVTIPKGIDDGEIIILREKGNKISEDNLGDIKLFIKIDNNTEFKRSGLDLLFEKTITVKEALCGFSFELKYITGKVYTITNNSGNIISPGYRKIINNMGFSRDQHVGNLIIMFTIQFPEKLSVESTEKLKTIDF
jgi:DnaJ-class molecular chaperone